MRQIYDRFMKNRGDIDSMLMIHDTVETVHYPVPAVNCAKNEGDDMYNPVHAFLAWNYYAYPPHL
ncbi:hypothetical protein BZH48_10730 [Salmonella enterica]|nr:hypothetical protein [Salmonella enterica]EBI8224882.1 hypothetical protein [Salmonella enterica]ECT9808199.1 hypothetical protein [Salmonella enterica]MEK57760.1 hypothetical protein [Salmonella enterica]HAC6492301.1 hypothetical protein [Salmonella enterica subsp. houtenae serovar 44:z36[z38]:-]